MSEMWQNPAFLQITHSRDKEWPGYQAPDDDDAPIPLLIAEIFRLVPYIGEQYVQFHPKNMPEVKINKIEIVGIVTNIVSPNRYLSYTVDDGTSAISVLCVNRKLERIELQESESSEDEPTGSTENKSSLPKKIPKLEPPFGLAPEAPYSYEEHMRNLWKRSIEEEVTNEIEMYDYVHVLGYCSMNFQDHKDINALTKEDIEVGRLFISGLNIRRLSETQHNIMSKNLITHRAKERYEKLEK